jgi:disulfide bond formation protein DsbB
VLAAVAVVCVALLAFGLYLQHVVGLEPCPMCIVQRYALVLVAVAAAWRRPSGPAAPTLPAPD